MDNKQINKSMEEKTQDSTAKQSAKKPDERGGILIQSHIKIFDPENQEVYVNGRA
jgi:hypothetical protein